MSLLRWLLRPELLVADAVLIGGIAGLGAGLLGVLSDPVAGSLRLLGALASGYGTLWILLYAGLSGRREPEARWSITRAIMWFANAALLLPIFLTLTAPTFGGGWGEPSPAILGLSGSVALATVAYVGIVVGWIWIRLIYRGDPEPEANDRFWWSRA